MFFWFVYVCIHHADIEFADGKGSGQQVGRRQKAEVYGDHLSYFGYGSFYVGGVDYGARGPF